MSISSRIPELMDVSFDGALQWFSELQCSGLLFHPDDDPADIVRIADGVRLFSAIEVDLLRKEISQLESMLGHEAMLEAAYPIFMKATSQMLDA